MPVNTHIRGLRQGIASGFVLGRQAGAGRGAVTTIPIPANLSSTGANATATAGGFVPQASVGTAGVGFNAAGVWSSSTAYNPGDVVTYNGSAYGNYVAVTSPGPNPSPDTDDAHWLSQGAVNTVDSNFTLNGGQLQLHTIASGDVLGNSGAGSAEPTAATLTAMIDRAFGSTEGQILQRGASAWQILAPGAAGQVLLSGGAAALNSWGTDQLGVATNSNAPSGDKGEFISSSVFAVSQMTATQNNLTTISLTAGDWNVFGGIEYNISGGTISDAYGCVSIVSGDVSQSDMLAAPWMRCNGLSGNLFGVHPPPLRVSVSGTTTVYLVAYCQFTGTATATGALSARRVR